MARGIIYILTNPMFKDNIVKIGKTERNVEDRIKELNRQTGVPFPFVCHSAFKIDNYDEIEKIIHSAYRGIGAHTDEEHLRKEFFEVNPEKARDLIFKISKLHNGQEIVLNDKIIYSPEEVKNLEEVEQKTIRTKTKFKNIDIDIGTELTFSRDDNKKCIVVKDNKVRYKGKLFSLTHLTIQLMNELGHKGCYNGYGYWKYDDEILWDRRKRIETENSECESED